MTRAAVDATAPALTGAAFPDHLFRVPGDPAAVRAAADVFRSRGLRAGEILQQLRGSTCLSWTGEDGDLYRDRLTDHTLTPTRAATTFTAVAEALRAHGTRLQQHHAEMAPVRSYALDVWSRGGAPAASDPEWQHCLRRARLILSDAEADARAVAATITGSPGPGTPLVSDESALDLAVAKLRDPHEWAKTANLVRNDDVPEWASVLLPELGLTANVLAVANVVNDAAERLQIVAARGTGGASPVDPKRLRAVRRMYRLAGVSGEVAGAARNLLSRGWGARMGATAPGWMRSGLATAGRAGSRAAQSLTRRLPALSDLPARLVDKPLNPPLARVTRVANKVAPWLGVVTSGLEQWTKDSANPTVPLGDRIGRTVTRAGIVGGAGWAGGEVGAVAGGVIGQVIIPIPGLGAAVGAVAGGIIVGGVAAMMADGATDKGMQHWDESIRRRTAQRPSRRAEAHEERRWGR